MVEVVGGVFAFTLIAAACGHDDTDPVATGDDTEDTAPEPTEEPVVEEEEAVVEEDEDPGFSPEACGELGPENGPIGAAAVDGGEGTLIWAHEQEPPDMHLDDPNNNLTTTAWTRQALLEGLYGIDQTTSYFPELLDGEAELVDNGDGTVTLNFTLRDGLTWSDGTALTSRDVVYTCRIILDPE